MTLYEVVNPSDAATFYAPDIGIAALAMLFLDGGEGKYAARAVDSDECSPIWAFHGGAARAEPWFGERGLWPIDDAIGRHRTELAAALRSVALGRARDRADFDDAVATITDPEARRAFIERRNDRHRSSLNDFETRAHEAADRLDQQPETAADGGRSR